PGRTASLRDALAATSVEEVSVVLPSSRRPVTVPGYVRDELRWPGELPRSFDSVPNKPAFAFDGGPLYPELIVVRLLERAGWDAAWRKNWNTVAYWRDIGEPVEPSALAVAIVDQVSRQAGHMAPWDIVAWRGRELRLLVSRTSDQRSSAYLANWLDAALRMGIPLGCFAVVEHRADPVPRRR
ncbi:MAG: hypothetical protein ACRDHD_09615, partial [Candidatus Limnocylindria bacterium]